MANARSGGGITMNKNVRVGVNAGAASRDRVNVSAVSKLGAKQGNHAESGKVNVKPEPLFAGKVAAVPLGNSVALNVNGGGPGKGRTVYRTGGQGRH